MTMTERWIEAIAEGGSPGANDSELDAAASSLGIELPEDYRAVMSRVNGGEAEFGESWFVLWSVADVVERNAGYQFAEFAPGFTLFGSDGGGEGYAWDTRPDRESLYTSIPFIAPDPKAAITCGNTFEEFMATLHRGIDFARNTS